MNTLMLDIATRYPYPGLRPFEPHEADIFFGRKRHVTDLLKRLKSQRFLVVVGPSGCGKSSLIRAGLIPSLRAGFMARNQCQWNFAVFRPGNQPLMRLAEALYESQVFGPTEEHSPQDAAQNIQYTKQCLEAGSRSLADRLLVNSHAHGTNLLILVDQFEELFRFEGAGGGDESRAFVNLLLETARDPDISAYVVLTMRTDFIGQCPVFAGLPEALNDSQYLTPRLTREQIESAIVGPARMFDSDVEPDVVNRILNEMGTDPDQLPLMQHLLMRMWRAAVQRDGKFKEDSELKLLQGQEAELDWSSVRLTMQDYKDTGGLLNALGQHAQGIYDVRLTTERQRNLAEQMFRRLTEVAPNGQLVRCSPAPKFGELCTKLEATKEELVKVIDVFRREGRSFLMPPPNVMLEAETPIDISHESLIRNWPLLNEWTRDEALADQIEAEVTKSAVVFTQGGHKAEDAAMPESRLALALDWAKKHPHDVNQEIGTFLNACVKTRDQSKRARRHVLIASAVALVLTIVTVLSAWQQQKYAMLLSQRFWRDAVQQLDSVSQGKEDLAAALIWAAEARQEEPKSLVLAGDRQSLYDVRFNSMLAQHPELVEVWRREGQTIKALSNNFRYVVTVDESKSELHIGSRQNPEEKPQKVSFNGTLADVKFDIEDRFMMTLSRNKHNFGKLTVWKFSGVGKLEPVSLPDADSMNVQAAEFAPATSSDKDASIVAIVRQADKGEPETTSVAQTKLMLWSSLASEPMPFSVAVEPVTRTTSIGPKAVSISPTQLSVSPDGRTVVAWGNVDRAQCGSLSLWDIESLKLRFHDSQSQSALVQAAFSKSSKLLITLDEAGKARLWDPVQATALTEAWSAHVGAGQQVLFTPNENNALTIGADNVARLWELPDRARGSASTAEKANPVLRTVFPHESDIYDATFNSDGKLLATAGRDRVARVWEVDSGQLAVPPLHHATGVDQVHFIGDQTSTQLLTSTFSIMQRWQLAAANPLPQTTMPISLEGTKESGSLDHVACSENGRFAAIATIVDESVHVDIWDSESRSTVNSKPLVHPGMKSINYAAISDNGRRLLIVANEATPETQAGLLWSWDGSEENKLTKLWSGAPSVRCCASFSHDAATLVVASEQPSLSADSMAWQLQIWNSGRSQLAQPAVVANVVTVNHIAWSPNGDMFTLSVRLRNGSEERGDAMLYGWNSRSGLTSLQIWHHTESKPEAAGNAVLHSVFSQDGKYVATGGVDNTAYLWSVGATDAVSPPLRHTSDIVHVAISADNKYLATSSVADMKTCVWSIDKIRSRSKPASPVHTFTHGAGVNRAVFSHDNKWLATASNDKLARVWSLSKGDLAAQFRHGGNVRGVSFTKDDSRLMTISDSSLTDRLSQLPKESWPKLYLWHLQPTDDRSRHRIDNIVVNASLLVASELNDERSSLSMFSTTNGNSETAGPEFADATYEALWKKSQAKKADPVK